MIVLGSAICPLTLMKPQILFVYVLLWTNDLTPLCSHFLSSLQLVSSVSFIYKVYRQGFIYFPSRLFLKYVNNCILNDGFKKLRRGCTVSPHTNWYKHLTESKLWDAKKTRQFKPRRECIRETACWKVEFEMHRPLCSTPLWMLPASHSPSHPGTWFYDMLIFKLLGFCGSCFL